MINKDSVGKRVAILIPTLKKGGAEKQAALLAKALSDNHIVYLIVRDDSEGLESELISLSGLPLDKLICLRGNQVRSLYNVFKHYNIRILFCYLTWPDFWGPIIGRLAGVTHIFQGIRNAQLPFPKLVLELVGNLFSTGAITNNYSGFKIFKRKGLRKQTVIPNCYLNPKDYVKRPAKEELTVITVGRFVEQKDYPTAIAAMAMAMKKIPSLRFKIIGHGELEEKIKEWLWTFGIENRTEVLINPKNILSHLEEADIYLSTSLFEGTSNSIMEALDAGLPVVATNVGDNNQLIEDGVSGFLAENQDISSIANHIVELANNPTQRLKMGKAGNMLLKERFSFELFKNRYLTLLESIEQ